MEEESTGDVIQIVRPAAVQKDRLACTAAQTLAGQNHMNKKADTPNCEWGEDCGSAFARSNPLVLSCTTFMQKHEKEARRADFGGYCNDNQHRPASGEYSRQS